MGDRVEFTATARRLGIFSAAATVILLVAYAANPHRGASVAKVSAAAHRRPDDHDPRGPDYHHDAGDGRAHGGARLPRSSKTLSLTSLIFMSLLAGVTCSLHFMILTLSRQPEFAGSRGMSWSSLLSGPRWHTLWTSWAGTSSLRSRCCSPLLSFREPPGRMDPRADDSPAGARARRLDRVVAGDMQLRNIGIVGYVGVFLIVAALLAVFFYRANSK